MVNGSLASAKSKAIKKLKEKQWNYFQISTSPSHALLHVRSGIHLYKFDQVPPFQQHNRFITSGYRSYLSAKQCLRSSLFLSNELINIWTHAGMIFLLLVILIYDQAFALPSMHSKIIDRFIFLTYTICIEMCMICSAGYHVFNCHVDEKVAIRWYAFDLYGITFAMLGCYAIGLYYGFYCVHIIRSVYCALVVFMILASGVFMLHPNYLADNWRNYRIYHLTSLCIFGFLPMFHWIYVSPTNEIKAYLPAVLGFYAVLGVAMFFYISRIPERFWPGKFNLFGHSHNWWHVLVNIAFLHWRNVAYHLLQYRLDTTCALPEL